jgi:hypothetical protein
VRSLRAKTCHKHKRTQVTAYGAATSALQARRGRVRTKHTYRQAPCTSPRERYVMVKGVCESHK